MHIEQTADSNTVLKTAQKNLEWSKQYHCLQFAQCGLHRFYSYSLMPYFCHAAKPVDE